MIFFLDWIGPMLLCPSEVGRVPPGIGGVYLLQAFAPSLGGYPVFYAGRSTDLKRRLCEHIGEWKCKRCVRRIRARERTYFSAAPVRAPLSTGVEAGLVRLLQPLCNDQIPRAEPIVVSLPPMAVVNVFKEGSECLSS